jgi:ATPase family AAA domain-containing protein 2
MELNEPVQLNIELENASNYPTISDLVGTSKDFAEDLIMSIKHSNIYERFSILPNKSFVLNGVPGTGKTFSLKAINNTLNGNIENKLKDLDLPKNLANNTELYNVAIIPYDIGSYGTAYVNRGSRIIQQFFDYVYNLSYGIPVIVKLDEADALLLSRDLEIHSEDRKNLETLMKNLQIAHDIPNVYIVMMTNRLTDMDQATYRAGRIDKNYVFSLPDKNERKILFNKIITKYNNKSEYDIIRQYDLQRLAELTENFSHADISAIIEQTLKHKIKSIIQEIEQKHIDRMGYITQKGLENSIEEHKKEFLSSYRQKQNIGFKVR